MSSENEVKSEVTEISGLEKKIIRQIEYYFGDANMIRDKFLKSEVAKDDGWVPLKTLLTFNRLKSLSEDPEVVVAAIKKSTNDLLQVNEDGTSIRRNPDNPMPEDDEQYRQDVKQRLLYVKGFPVESTLDELLSFFEEYGGESVQLRTDVKKEFKGSVFTLFKSKEAADKFMAAEEIKYGETPLIERMTKENYFKKKNASRLEMKQDELKKKEEMKIKKEAEEKEELLKKIVQCSVLKVTGVSQDSSVEKLKEFFGNFGKVAWVDFSKGDDDAFVRFGNENEAKTAWEAAVAAGEDGKVLFGEKELQASPLEGEEEEIHWKKMFQSIHERNSRDRNRSGRPTFRGKGRKGGQDHGEPVSKKAKTEAST